MGRCFFRVVHVPIYLLFYEIGMQDTVWTKGMMHQASQAIFLGKIYQADDVNFPLQKEKHNI